MDSFVRMASGVSSLQALAVCCYSLFGTVGDAVLLAAWLAWKRRTLLPQFLDRITRAEAMYSVAAIATAVIMLRSLRWFGQPKAKACPAGTGYARPLLFPSRTTHTRLFPKKHSFQHSYLSVGIPVEWEGVSGGMISTGASLRRGWYQIDAAAYLERGNAQLGLRGKMDAYLRSQNVEPADYPHAYLITAPKFFGYQFNPVSFWYLYSSERELTAMILEVNNTFDERRMYFLPRNSTSEGEIQGASMDGVGGDGSSESVGKSPAPFKHAWPKDFHVSPFNSRKGSYSLVAYDPFAVTPLEIGTINNTINLISSKNHPKLIARIFSEGPAIDPATMTPFQKVRFLTDWFWIGFMTFPRICKEAAMLYLKHKLHVWYRPEPLQRSMGRMADGTERELEKVFRKYLRHLVEESPTPLSVRYQPSGIADAHAETMQSPSARKDPATAQEMEFKILTPVFYSRFVGYAHDLEAVFCELNESCTIWVSRPDLLPKIVLKKPAPPLHTASYLEYAYFKAIQRLRRRPERIERPMTSAQAPNATSPQADLRSFRLSSMDGFVLCHGDSETKKMYRSLVLKLFLADRVAQGSVDILWLESFILRLGLAWLVIG